MKKVLNFLQRVFGVQETHLASDRVQVQDVRNTHVIILGPVSWCAMSPTLPLNNRSATRCLVS